jgi:hypothetical protein
MSTAPPLTACAQKNFFLPETDLSGSVPRLSQQLKGKCRLRANPTSKLIPANASN